VSDIEIKSQQKSYTVDTVKKHQRLYPDSELFLILGIDAFLDLPYWKQPLRLINLVNFIVMSRPGYTFSDLYALPYLKGTTKKALKELDKGEIMELSSDISLSTRLFLRKVTGLGIASSHIRSMVKCSENIKYLLPDSVKSYIISNKLYV
jgi:nicotinate-nucleotide adenylyltransferase